MVQTITEPGKYFDGHGLYLRVDKTGGKFWIQRIVINGKRCELGMGSVDFVTLADARIAAFENRKIARAGGDPLAGRRQVKAVLTLEQAAQEALRPQQQFLRRADRRQRHRHRRPAPAASLQGLYQLR